MKKETRAYLRDVVRFGNLMLKEPDNDGKISFDNTYIPKEEIVEMVEKAKSILDGREIDYFECVIPLKLVFFSKFFCDAHNAIADEKEEQRKKKGL